MTGKAREKLTWKLTIPNMVPERLRRVADQKLLSINRRLHQLYGAHFESSDSMSAGDLNREDLVNAAIFVWAEMRRRRMQVSENTPLFEAAASLRKQDPDPENTSSHAEEEGLDVSLRDDTYSLFSTERWEHDHVETEQDD